METTIWGLGFPKTEGTILGLPIKATIAVWHLYPAMAILGTCQIRPRNFHVLGMRFTHWGLLGKKGTYYIGVLQGYSAFIL